jgi:cysteine desulfurase
MSRRIYLDFNASTPIAPEAVDAMRPFLSDHYGNPSSNHWASSAAGAAIREARSHIADLLSAKTDEIVFTSGGSEANNNAIKGIFYSSKKRGRHIITTAIEHPAVIEPCEYLRAQGATVSYLPVDGTGLVDPDDVERAITPETILISVMHANNEVGTIQPIAEIAAIARRQGVPMHCDAAQSIGKIPVDVEELGVDLLSLAGHKLYAPKGVGALYIRDGVQIAPLIHGGGHESGRRAGTENVLLTVGLGAACRIAREHVKDDRLTELRDRLWALLSESFGDHVKLNGHKTRRLPNTVNVNFPGRIGAEILSALDGVAASTGSACHGDSIELSPVLRAMGVPEKVGMGAIRFSLGRTTTADEINEVAELLKRII